MILGRPYFGSECDVWSLGVILYTMLTATMPFDDRDIPSFLSCVEKGIYPEPPEVSESEFVHCLADFPFPGLPKRNCLVYWLGVNST